jgi:hypothetical protein
VKRKTFWIALENGKVVGIFPSKKRAYTFCGEDVVLTKMIWNGYYHSEKPLDYDPYATYTVSLFEPMF